jgi:FkbM family methyltransferase
MEQKSILEFLKSDTPVARHFRISYSRINNGMLTFYAFRKGSISLWELLILLLPMRFFPLKKKYLSKRQTFIEEETKEEIAPYLTKDGSIPVDGYYLFHPNLYEEMELISQVIFCDQYHARQFLNQDSIVIDAGANVGTFSIFAASIATHGHIYAFEPTASTFSLLEKNAQNFPYNITCVNSGLGEAVSEKNILNLGMGSGGNVIEDSPFYKNSNADEGKLEKVTIITIDQFVAENNIPRVDFIKIDTEGYEANILRGAAETIKKFKPVIAMSAYHNPGDKKDLPRIVQSLVPEYVCELHKDAEEDFICYIPN